MADCTSSRRLRGRGELIPVTNVFGSKLLKPDNSGSLLTRLRGFLVPRLADTYLVGGFVRDTLLGESSSDIDIAVSGDAMFWAREIANYLGGTFIPLDEVNSVGRVVCHVATTVENSGDLYQIDVVSYGDDINHHLSLRDFTVNAMAIPLTKLSEGDELVGNLLDPFGGTRDLEASILKSVSYEVFRNDPLRLLRGVRLSAQLGFLLEDKTQNFMSRDAHLLVNVAQERVRDELLKTLAEPGATKHLRLMDKLSLLGYVIPELEDTRYVVQPSEHYWDVFNHLIETPGNVELVTEPSNKHNSQVASHVPWRSNFESRFEEEISDGHTRLTLLKLAGLLHDIAKPATRSIETSGRLRFIGHDIQGANATENILRRLRLSNRGVNLVSKMVRHHLRPTQMSQHVNKPTQKALYRYFRDLGEVAIDVLFLNMADYLAAKGPQVDVEDWRSHCELMDHIMISGLERMGIPKASKSVIDGHELMAELNISPGKQVGWILEEIREAQSGGVVDSKEAALSLARYLVKNTNGTTSED